MSSGVTLAGNLFPACPQHVVSDLNVQARHHNLVAIPAQYWVSQVMSYCLRSDTLVAVPQEHTILQESKPGFGVYELTTALDGAGFPKERSHDLAYTRQQRDEVCRGEHKV